MYKRHLVLSDIHENGESLFRFMRKAEAIDSGFDDIWLLGDLFGHSSQSSGNADFNLPFLDALDRLSDFPISAVIGNWEYWLLHPERDDTNEAQSKCKAELVERRQIITEKKIRLFDKIMEKDVICLPEENPQFTIFHGCSYSCHDGQAYHAEPCESYLNPKDLNIVTGGLFENRENLTTPHFLFGHTHIPGYFVYSVSTFVNIWLQFTPSITEQKIEYGNGMQRFGINPGSAGAEYGDFPRTALILDTEEQTFQFIADQEPLDS